MPGDNRGGPIVLGLAQIEIEPVATVLCCNQSRERRFADAICSVNPENWSPAAAVIVDDTFARRRIIPKEGGVSLIVPEHRGKTFVLRRYRPDEGELTRAK